MLSTYCVPDGGKFCACCAASVRHVRAPVAVATGSSADLAGLSSGFRPHGCWVVGCYWASSLFCVGFLITCFLGGCRMQALHGRPGGTQWCRATGVLSMTRWVSSSRLIGTRSCSPRSEVSRLPLWELSCLLSSTKGRGIKGCGEEEEGEEGEGVALGAAESEGHTVSVQGDGPGLV